VRVRDRVVVEVEADVGGLAYVDDDALLGRVGVGRQGEQLAALLGEELADGAPTILGARSISGDPLRPGERLGVEVVEVGVGARGEEVVADVADGALDAPLLVASRRGDGAGQVVVVGRQLEQGGMEADRVAGALEHGALEVVVEQHARDAAEEVEGVDVPANEARHRRAQVEAQEDLATPRQHHHEGPQHPRAHADADLAEVLSLLAGQRAQPQVRLGRRTGTVARHDRAEVIGPARVAASLDHLEEPAGAQARVLPERLLDEGHVRVHHRGPQRHAPGVEPGLSEHTPDGAVVDAELGGDGADAPLLRVVQAQDLGFSVAPDHDTTLRSSSTRRR
jgi:hypothetical protein